MFVLFLSLTARTAAQNVLGDVGLKKAFAVGPVPATIVAVLTSFGWNSFVAPALILGLGFSFAKYFYGRSTRLSVYVIAIHFIALALPGFVLFGLSAILLTAPF